MTKSIVPYNGNTEIVHKENTKITRSTYLDELDAENEAYSGALAYAQELQMQAAQGKTKSATCSDCGKVEVALVGTPFRDVVWQDKNRQDYCNECAQDACEAKYPRRTPFEWLVGRDRSPAAQKDGTGCYLFAIIAIAIVLLAIMARGGF